MGHYKKKRKRDFLLFHFPSLNKKSTLLMRTRTLILLVPPVKITEFQCRRQLEKTNEKSFLVVNIPRIKNPKRSLFFLLLLYFVSGNLSTDTNHFSNLPQSGENSSSSAHWHVEHQSAGPTPTD